MTFHATVIQVLIASPGDTQQERSTILAETSRWNGRHARGRGFVLSPWLYELHSTPVLGDRPQAIINAQGVHKSDVVVAVFGARLGTDTGVDVSGTSEEINNALDMGIPVHVFFKNSELPNDVDVDQLTKLREFRGDLQGKGLYAEYKDANDLARQVIEALEYDLDAFESLPAPEAPTGVRLKLDHKHTEREKGLDKRNRMQYQSVVRDLMVENIGDATAEQLQLQLEGPEDALVSMDEIGEDGWSLPRDLTAGSTFGLRCVPLRGRFNAQIVAKWIEDGTAHTHQFTTQIT